MSLKDYFTKERIYETLGMVDFQEVGLESQNEESLQDQFTNYIFENIQSMDNEKEENLLNYFILQIFYEEIKIILNEEIELEKKNANQ